MFACRPMLEQVAEQTTKPGVWTPYASGAEVAESKALLADIASDGKLTPHEKRIVNREWSSIKEQFLSLDAQCVTLALDDYRENQNYATFVDGYNELDGYINPLIANLTTTSDIVSWAFNAFFK
ncbi:hypothetical protein JZU68_08585, partial [bacterium]|nr:hypothetical protein [bacterium]